MHVVIEISSYDKEWITNGYYIPEEINIKISEAIANGIILPEGHGRFDADEIQFENDEFDTYSDYSRAFDTIDYAPTIIEADKESEDKE